MCSTEGPRVVLGLSVRKPVTTEAPLPKGELTRAFEARAEALGIPRSEGVSEALRAALGAARGEARGEIRGYANVLLRVLKVRKIHVPKETREKILGCTEPELLRRWIDRAVTAEKLADVFD